MEVIGHLIFEIIKISFLSVFYATLILLTITYLGKDIQNSRFNIIARKKTIIWVLNGLMIFVGLFYYMFTFSIYASTLTLISRLS